MIDNIDKSTNEIINVNMNEQWHLDKKVPLSLIFAMIIQVAIVVWAIADIKKDVEILKSQVVWQRDRDDQQDKAQARQLLVVTQSLDRIDTKLDRLIERQKR